MPPKAAAKKKTTPKKAATWQRTQSKATMPDGKKKTLYRHSETGEMRVRKMVTRGGKKVASYVKVGSRGGGEGLAPPELCDYQEPEEGMSTPGTMVFSAVKDGKLVKQCNKIKLGNIVYYQKRESDGIDGQYVEGDYDKAFFCNNVVGVKNCSRFGQVCLTNNNRYIDEYTHNQVDGDPTCDPLGAT